MSYLALARKWRPRTFSQLIGQPHINNALINALNQQRLHHAYLFTGTRGVGKTSVARILAKSFNCEQGICSEPCLRCSACEAIERGCFIDLIEIDGASKTRVEDTRELLDNVQYAPTNGRFKIYLIDEVHMLSQHSFNALLKTLEEPPEHVKFILATTDPQKLPATVLSRCLQFNLKHLPTELISQHLQLILEKEQLNFETEAVHVLAHAARGSMRDALSLLDQAIIGCDDKLQIKHVNTLLGYTQHDYALQLLNALAEQNALAVVTTSHLISMEGGHFQYVMDALLDYLHQMAVFQSIGDANPLVSPSAEVKSLAQRIVPEDIQLFYQIGLKGREEIHLAPTLAIGFNMTMLRMLTFRPEPKVPTPPLASYKKVMPTQPDSSLEKSAAASEKHRDELSRDKSPNSDTQNTDKKPDIPENKNWTYIISQLRLTGLTLNAIENTELIAKEGAEITVRVAKGHQSLFTPAVLTRIEAALSQYYQHPIKIILNSEELIHSSPAQQKEQAMQQTHPKAKIALDNDVVFQQLQREFSAELVKNSIVPLKDDL